MQVPVSPEVRVVLKILNGLLGGLGYPEVSVMVPLLQW